MTGERVTGSVFLALKSVNATKRTVYLSLVTFVSGLCWYFGNGLTGDYWYLTWLAPILPLISSFYLTPKNSFWLAFAAALLGRLSWFTYLETVVSLVPALLLTLALAYVFARIVVYSRTIILNREAWYTVLAYPVLMTSFEFLVLTFSPDGTATSLAYSQADLVPLIQIASLTGSLGITFLVSFFPAVIALSWLAYERKKRWLPYLVSSALLLSSASFFYGLHRISDQSPKPGIKAGLVVLAEKSHHKARQSNLPKIRAVIDEYSRAVAQLAMKGAAVVILPETAFRLAPENYPSVVSLLSSTAQRNNVQLVVGLADYSQANARNTAFVVSPSGELVIDYTKNHLVRGFEHQFTPGHQIGLFSLAAVKSGIAICKDLDFPGYMRRYGREKITILFVPANDFVVDDWLHSRMAILRGVENGFSVVRTARQGRLTISDPYGQILCEANASRGNKTLLLGPVPSIHEATLYAKAGDWFGLLNLVAAAYLLWQSRVNKKSVPQRVGSV